MPPKSKISKEEIISGALSLVRKEGLSALNARRLADSLSCSTQPIFSNFSNMEELQMELLLSADKLYNSYLREDISSGEYPPYKASGMAYIRFAKEERELFKLLFMRDRRGEHVAEDRESVRPILDIIMTSLGITEDQAYLLHMEMWIFVHGIASMVATNYLDWDIPFTSQALTDAYLGLKHKYEKEEAL